VAEPTLLQIMRPSSRSGPAAGEDRTPPRPAMEMCEVCGAPMAEEHGHLVNMVRRSVMCVCRHCYLLFTHDGAGGGRFRAIPQRYVRLPGFAAASEDWESLQIPIGLAFLLRSSATGRVTAFYPGPAGATESELPLDAWDRLLRRVPALSSLSDDVEALLVRMRAEQCDAFIVPIDACYELVGRIRVSWSGFQGGDEVWREVDRFITRAGERAEAAARR
jgi:hypothetical protein